MGLAFILLFVFVVWTSWSFESKNAVFERYFRLMEVAFFFMPISAIIMTFVLGAQAVSSTTSAGEQAGAAIGTAIGGTFVIVIACIVGLTMGIIMHLVSGSYAKKTDAEHIKQPETFATKHGVILSIFTLIVLALVFGSISNAPSPQQPTQEKKGSNSSLQQGDAKQAVPANAEQAKIELQKVTLEITDKGFHQADYMSGSYQDQITMSLKFTNNTDKEIRGVEGALTFYDIFDNEISAKSISYDKEIPAKESKVWESGIDYNQFMDEDVKLKNTELKNLKYKWNVSTIVYVDGNKDTF